MQKNLKTIPYISNLHLHLKKDKEFYFNKYKWWNASTHVILCSISHPHQTVTIYIHQGVTINTHQGDTIYTDREDAFY